MGKLATSAGAAAAIGGAYKLSEFLYKAKRLRDVGPSNAVYVRLIGRVRSVRQSGTLSVTAYANHILGPR